MPANSSRIVVKDNGAFGRLDGVLQSDGRLDLDPRSPPASIRGRLRIRPSEASEAVAWIRSDVSSRIAVFLGEPAETQDRQGIRLRWSDQAGSITFTVPSHPSCEEAEKGWMPGVVDHCHIDIVPGWRRPLDAEEIRIIDDMNVIGRGDPSGLRAVMTNPPGDEDSGYIREPGHRPGQLDGILGVDVNKGLLVACPGRLLLMPLDEIRSFRHAMVEERGSIISARMTSRHDIVIVEHHQPHGLDLVVRGLARNLEMRIEG